MRLFLALTLVACGGVTPSPEYPSPLEEEATEPLCDPAAPVERTTLLMEPPGLIVQHDTCDEDIGFGFAYDRGVVVGDTWLVPIDRVIEASAAETSRALPPADEWITRPTDDGLGVLQPLTEGWLFSPGAPTYANTFVATNLEAVPVLDRVRSVYGEPAAPIFVVPSWGAGEGEQPWMIASFDEDPNVFGPQVLRAYLGPGDAWLDGFATFLWRYLQMREGSVSMDDYLDSWLEHYTQHRRALDGRAHRHSALAAQVRSICLLPSLGDSDTRRIQHRLPEHEPAWLDERGVLDMRECLAEVGVQLAAIRYEDATPEALLRVRSAPGDPPTVARGGSFFRTGDVITEVNRRRIHTRGDVAWALRDVETGERFIIVVQREGREARTWARRPRVGERNAARFALIPIEADES